MEFPNLRDRPRFSYDTETTGLIYPRDRAFGFSVAVPGDSWYWDIRETPQAKEWFNDEVTGYDGTIICHNASFDYRMSLSAGIWIPIHTLDDTCIRAGLIDEHLLNYELDNLCNRYLGRGKTSEIYGVLAGMFGGPATRKAQIHRIKDAPSDVVAQYACPDAELAFALYEWQELEIDRQDKPIPLRNICDFERRLMPTIIRTETAGVRVDIEQAERAANEITPHIQRAQSVLDSLAGVGFNSNSPKQVRELFKPVDGPGGWSVGEDFIGTTAKGGPSFKGEFLREMSHPAAQAIVELRSLIKTRDTFLLGHILGHHENGRVYPNINQTKGEDGGTGTGRFSYTNPALQQIPSRNKDIAKIVKACFLPDEGQIWLDSDKDSFEVRVFAHLINVPNVIQAYHDNPELDMHQWVADQTQLVRNATYSGQPNAKQLNLSAIFNSGDGAIAAQMGMPWKWTSFETRAGETVTYRKAGVEAMEVINRYHRKLPGVKDLAKGCKRVAEDRGFIHTAFGRRLRFPRGYKSYKASGLLIQSTSADVNKENWTIIEEALGDQGRLVLNTHDSYGMSLEEDTWREAWGRVKGAVERPGRIRVPLILALSGTGKNWWDAINEQNS